MDKNDDDSSHASKVKVIILSSEYPYLLSLMFIFILFVLHFIISIIHSIIFLILIILSPYCIQIHKVFS